MRGLPLIGLVAALLWPAQAFGGLFDPDPADAGVQAYEAQDYDGAIGHFTDALLDAPNDPLLHFDLGAALYKGGRFDEAQAAFEQAAAGAQDPELAHSALYNLGNSLFNLGKLEEAVAAYEEALKWKPEDPDTQHNLELVRDEIRRRMEDMQDQQQQRQQQENQQPSDDTQAGDEQQQGQGQPQPDENNPQAQEQGQGDQDEQPEGQPQPQPSPEQGEGEQTPTPQGAGQAQGAPQQGDGQEEQPPEGNAQAQANSGETTTEEMSEQDAERLLKQLEEDGQELQRRSLQRKGGRGTGRGPQW